MPSDKLLSTLQALADVLQSQGTLGETLANIAQAATASVPGCDAASVAISIEGRPATTAATARVALELDLVQYDTAEGPCLTAFHSISTVRIDLVEQGERFPYFAVAAHGVGIRSVLSVPATWGPEVVATLNLYSRTGPFDETGDTIAAVLAAEVAIAVSRSAELPAARAVVEEAQRDVDDRATVNVATGLVTGNMECTVGQAQGLLRHAAMQDEKTILRIAQRIMDHHNRSD